MINLSIGFTIIILIILVPGAIFKRCYHADIYSNYNQRANTFTEIIFTLGVGLLFQAIWLFIIDKVVLRFCSSCPMPNLVGFISLFYTPSQEIIDSIGTYLYWILFYNLSLWFCILIFARLLLYTILRNNWDTKYQALQFDNSWQFLFATKPNQGEIIRLAHVLLNIDDSILTIYKGVICGYSRNLNGDLDAINLKGVSRKTFSKSLDKANNSVLAQDFPNPEEILVIPYREIKNISIRTVTIVSQSAATSPTTNNIQGP